MKHVIIVRGKQNDQGRVSVVSIAGDDFRSLIMELPWRNNQHNISCIPPGNYPVVPYRSPKFGLVYLITKVSNRSGVLFHTGNFAGDVSKGFKTHSHGCALHGTKEGIVSGQRAVLLSKNAQWQFKNAVGEEQFLLTIIDSYGN